MYNEIINIFPPINFPLKRFLPMCIHLPNCVSNHYFSPRCIKSFPGMMQTIMHFSKLGGDRGIEIGGTKGKDNNLTIY